VTSATLFIPQIDTGNDNLNRVFLFVADQSGNPVGGFRLGNFTILEGGSPGVPFEVGPVADPLFLALTIDRSGSMAIDGRTAAANAAGVDLINALGSSDYAALIEFETTVQVTVGFTTNKQTLINAINAGGPLGATALYDAVSVGADLLDGQPGRRLLIVLTDGEDTASTNTLESSIQNVNRRGLSAYTVGLGDGISDAVLDQIASDTGGIYATSLSGADLTNIFLGILERFNNLTYTKYRRRAKGLITVYLNMGAITANASKSLD
jgi:Ca-activated chloride channel family protein